MTTGVIVCLICLCRAEIFYDGKREVEGFVGGTGVKSSGKGFFK